jgi:hypothetical protein
MRAQKILEAKLQDEELRGSLATRQDIVNNISALVARRIENRKALKLKPTTNSLEAIKLIGLMIAEGNL